MSPAAADLYYGLPGWMKAAFAVGSFGGLLGCAMLVLRYRAAVPIFAVSLIGYAVLFAGDLAYDVFDVIPGQMAVLMVVVAVAAALMGAGMIVRRRGISG